MYIIIVLPLRITSPVPISLYTKIIPRHLYNFCRRRSYPPYDIIRGVSTAVVVVGKIVKTIQLAVLPVVSELDAADDISFSMTENLLVRKKKKIITNKNVLILSSRLGIRTQESL